MAIQLMVIILHHLKYIFKPNRNEFEMRSNEIDTDAVASASAATGFSIIFTVVSRDAAAEAAPPASASILF